MCIRTLRALSLAAAALLVYAARGFGGEGLAAPDHYLCYRTTLAKAQPKLPKGTTTQLDDRFGGPQTFDVTKITAICNPVNLDSSGIAHPDVHQDGFAIRAHKGDPKFIKSEQVTLDAFAQRTLTITAPVGLLDVTPKVLGNTPPAAFSSDPTSDPTVNRFKCYKARLAKGSPKFVPPPSPTAIDEFFASGQQLVVKKVTKLCEPADEDGETPGAETRQTALVCYGVKLTTGSPKFVKTTVATDDGNFPASAQVLVATAPAELCMPAVEATPTSTATPTAMSTPSPTSTPGPEPGKRVFVTSTTTDGGFGGIVGADAICAGRALAANVSGTFRAWVSVSGDGPSTRFSQSLGVYSLLDGTPIANNWSDLVDGTLAHAIDIDENGAHAGGSVWTSTDASGNPTTNNCNDFSTTSGGVSGVCGDTAQTAAGWTDSSTPGCALKLRLYCFEQ
jgi:hypothetical protein